MTSKKPSQSSDFKLSDINKYYLILENEIIYFYDTFIQNKNLNKPEKTFEKLTKDQYKDLFLANLVLLEFFGNLDQRNNADKKTIRNYLKKIEELQLYKKEHYYMNISIFGYKNSDSQNEKIKENINLQTPSDTFLTTTFKGKNVHIKKKFQDKNNYYSLSEMQKIIKELISDYEPSILEKEYSRAIEKINESSKLPSEKITTKNHMPFIFSFFEIPKTTKNNPFLEVFFENLNLRFLTKSLYKQSALDSRHYHYLPNSINTKNWGIKELYKYPEYERGKYIISSWLYSNFISNSFYDKDLIKKGNYLKKITEIDFNSDNFKKSLTNLIYSLRWNNHYSITNKNLKQIQLKKKDFFYVDTNYYLINNNLLHYFDNYKEEDFRSFLKDVLLLDETVIKEFCLYTILNFNILFNYWKNHLLQNNKKLKLGLYLQKIDYWLEPTEEIKQALATNVDECKKLVFDFEEYESDPFYSFSNWKIDQDFSNKMHVELVVLYYNFFINFNSVKNSLLNQSWKNKNILMELKDLIKRYSQYLINEKLQKKEIEVLKEYLYIKYKFGYVIGQNERGQILPGFSTGYYTYLSSEYKEYNEKLEKIFKGIESKFIALDNKLKKIKKENDWIIICIHNDLKLILNNIYNKFYNPYRSLSKQNRLDELKNEFINIILKRNFIFYTESNLDSTIYSGESIFKDIEIPDNINTNNFWTAFEEEFNIDNISHKLSRNNNWVFKSTSFDSKYSSSWNKEEIKTKILKDFNILNKEVKKVKKIVLSEDWKKNL